MAGRIFFAPLTQIGRLRKYAGVKQGSQPGVQVEKEEAEFVRLDVQLLGSRRSLVRVNLAANCQERAKF